MPRVRESLRSVTGVLWPYGPCGWGCDVDGSCPVYSLYYVYLAHLASSTGFGPAAVFHLTFGWARALAHKFVSHFFFSPPCFLFFSFFELLRGHICIKKLAAEIIAYICTKKTSGVGTAGAT